MESTMAPIQVKGIITTLWELRALSYHTIIEICLELFVKSLTQRGENFCLLGL